MQVVNGHMKRCSTLLIIREMQTRTSVNYELMLVRVAIVKKNLQKTNAGENLEKREPSYTFFFPSYTFDEDANKCIHYGRQFGGSLQSCYKHSLKKSRS